MLPDKTLTPLNYVLISFNGLKYRTRFFLFKLHSEILMYKRSMVKEHIKEICAEIDIFRRAKV